MSEHALLVMVTQSDMIAGEVSRARFGQERSLVLFRYNSGEPSFVTRVSARRAHKGRREGLLGTCRVKHHGQASPRRSERELAAHS
jgi:hypothetical protein